MPESGPSENPVEAQPVKKKTACGQKVGNYFMEVKHCDSL